MTASTRRIDAIDTTVAVETPEHVRFRHQVVGPVRRGLAWLIDVVLRALLVALLYVVLALPLGFDESMSGITAGWGAVIVFAAEWFYFAAFEALWSGRTPGKHFIGLRVLRDDGQPIDSTAAILRNLLRAADFLPGLYAIGATVMTRDPRFRRLGDLAAGTMVVVESRRKAAIPYQLSPPPTAEEIAWVESLPTLALQDLKTIDLLLRRSARLHFDRISELAEMIAPVYATKLGAQFREPVRFLALLHFRSRNRMRPPAARGGRR